MFSPVNNWFVVCHIKLQAFCDKPVLLILTSICHSLCSLWGKKKKRKKKKLERNKICQENLWLAPVLPATEVSSHNSGRDFTQVCSTHLLILWGVWWVLLGPSTQLCWVA